MRDALNHAARPAGTLAAGALLACSACSPGRSDESPTETQIHQSGARHPPHRFVCDDGGTLVVDFEGQGLTLRVRDGAAAPVVLVAPAQGRPFTDAGITATLEDRELKLTSNGIVRTCLRQSKG